MSSVVNSIRPGHPRLILLTEDVARVAQTVESDPMARACYAELLRKGEGVLSKPLPERVLEGREAHYMFMLAVSRRVLDHVYTLGLLFRLTRESRWAERAVAEMLAAARFVDWNPPHWLDTAEMMHALAIGYDWLYDVLLPGQRAEIAQAILDKGLREAEIAYAETKWFTVNEFNWNTVCNGGIIIGALALADEHPELADKLIRLAVERMPIALATFAPDGAWSEGPAYWAYAMRYATVTFAAMKSALGQDFGLSDLPGLAQAGTFYIQSVSPTGDLFNFADARPNSWFEPSLYWLAHHYNTPLFAFGAVRSFQLAKTDAEFGALARALMWFMPAPDSPAGLALDVCYPRTGVAYLRSSWAKADAIYVGFKGGENKVNHSHVDLGTFVLDALGERWAIELGSDDYTLPGYWDYRGQRWAYYRLGTPGHNTLVFDGQHQPHAAAAPVIEFTSLPTTARIAIDLTAAYAPAGGRHVIRTLELDRPRSTVTIQDDIELERPVNVNWRMHTNAQVELDGRRATLHQNGKAVELTILSPEAAQFIVEPVTLDLPQLPLTNVRRLMIDLPQTDDTRIVVQVQVPHTS